MVTSFGASIFVKVQWLWRMTIEDKRGRLKPRIEAARKGALELHYSSSLSRMKMEEREADRQKGRRERVK